MGSEKNATGGTARVNISDRANDIAATSARTSRYGRPEEAARAPVRRRACRMSHAVPMIKGGHTR